MADEESDSAATDSDTSDVDDAPTADTAQSSEPSPDSEDPAVESDQSAASGPETEAVDGVDTGSDSSAGSPRFCRDCGSPLAPGANFCRECGTAQNPAARAGQRRGQDSAGQYTGHQAPGGQQYHQYGDPGRAVTAGPDSDTGMAAIAHLLALFLWIVGPILIYATSEDPFVRQNAANATNWQIMLMVYSTISMFLALLIVGVFMLLALIVMDFVFIIVAAIKASEGEAWQYPLTPDIL